MAQDQIDSYILTEISLVKLELVVVDVPQHEVFISAIGKRKSRKALIVRWTNKNGAVGYGECSCRPDPFYSHEFVEGAILVIKEFIFPRLVKAVTYLDVLTILNSIRGWNFTKAAIEFAMNDVIRKEQGSGIIEASGIMSIDKVPVGVSMGLFESKEKLEEKVNEAQALKYQRLKFKISPNYRDTTILSELASLNGNVSLDANGTFREDDFEALAGFAAMGFIIEQPYPPTELFLHSAYLKRHPKFTLCLDEDIESYGNLVSLATEMDEVNIKPGRVGGLFVSLKMINYCLANHLDAWIGGMFETGIGRAQNLQLAALLGKAKAHDLSPSSRYFSKDVVKEPIVMEDGYIDKKYFNRIEVDEEVVNKMALSKIILKK